MTYTVLPEKRARDFRHAGEIAEAAAAANWRRVFIHPSSHIDLGLPDHIPARGDRRHRFCDEAMRAGVTLTPAKLAAEITARVGDQRVDLEFPGWGDGIPFAKAASVPEMYRALKLFEEHIGVPWTFNAGRTNEALVRSTHPPQRGGVQLHRVDPPPPAQQGNLEAAPIWVRALTAAERKRSTVHAYDINAQYLAAWSSLECGLDQLEHLGGDVVLDRRLPGYWHLLDAPPRSRALPALWRKGWVHTETAVLASEILGRPPAISEAWVYNGHTRYLTGAYERIRDARKRLMQFHTPEAAIALKAVKGLYQRGHGRFGAGYRFRSPDKWLRPDWRHGTIARARANLYRRLIKLEAAPFAIDTDAIAFASDEVDPIAFAAAIGIPIGIGLGQFKHKGSAPMGAVFHRAASGGAVMRAIKEVVQ